MSTVRCTMLYSMYIVYVEVGGVYPKRKYCFHIRPTLASVRVIRTVYELSFVKC